MIKVSVVLAVYNGERYLRECLKSILAQTLRNIEIICVNDASTDSTSEILNEYADQIIILTNDYNLMAGESRNRGFSKAQGEYVIFLDADDIFEPDMLEKVYEKARGVNAEIGIFKEDQFFDGTTQYIGYSYAESIMSILGEKDFFSPLEVSEVIFNLWNGWAWDKVFQRKFLVEKQLRFPNIRTSEDGFLVHAALASAERIAFVNKEFVHHRIGNTNSLSSSRTTAWESCFIYLKELKKYLSCNGLLKMYNKSFINWACEFLYWNYQTLHEKVRESFFLELQKYMFNELHIGDYKSTYFYNAFSFQISRYIIAGYEACIPVSEKDRFYATYDLNERKLEELYLFFAEKRWNIALWGAGTRGQAFMEVYGARWNLISCIFDMDKEKQGKSLKPSGVGIKLFETNQIENINCILVLNTIHISAVKKQLKGKNVTIFDLNSYLTLPQSIKECFII